MRKSRGRTKSRKSRSRRRLSRYRSGKTFSFATRADENGNTALFHAVRNNHLDLVKTMIESGADVNHRNRAGDTALIVAVSTPKGDDEIAQLLLEKKANPNDVSNNYVSKNAHTALELAVQNERDGMIIALLKNGANPENIQMNTSKHGRPNRSFSDSAFALLSSEKNGKTVTRLEHTIRKSEQGEKLLAAALAQNKEEVRKLLSEGAAVDYRDTEGKTALFYAIQQGNMDTVQLLIQNEANPAHKDRNGKTAMDYFTI